MSISPILVPAGDGEWSRLPAYDAASPERRRRLDPPLASPAGGIPRSPDRVRQERREAPGPFP
ncbi:MAG TPA: hypothetical protein VFH97_05905 [Gemmatimonadales bacterium]|nr:hypothetical protein [Gemmatimonadales bacterium]